MERPFESTGADDMAGVPERADRDPFLVRRGATGLVFELVRLYSETQHR